MDDLEIEKQKAELQVQEAEYKAFSFFKGFNRALLYWTLILLILSIPIYFTFKFSVAALYMRNFRKREITAHPASVEASNLPINIVKSKILPISGDRYSAYAILDNPYSQLSADKINYSFYFIGSSGQDIDTESGQTFLLAGQRNKLIIIPDVALRTPPSSLRVEISKPDWKYKLNLPDVILDAAAPTYGDQQNPNGFSVSGTVKNATAYNLGSVVVKAAVYDASGKIIAVTQSILGKMSAHQTQTYTLYWPIFLQAKVQRVQIIPETDILDPQNVR